MSFILDALKKSEADRQRQNVPGLLDLGPATPRPRFPVWGIWLGLLLGVNLLVLMVLLIRGWIPGGAAPAADAKTPAHVDAAALKAPAAAPVVAATTATAAPATAAPPRTTADSSSFSPMDAPVYAPEIPVANDAAPGPSVAAGTPAAEPAATSRPDPRLAKALYPPPPPDEVLPTLNEIRLSGNHGIPELHMDIHVYAARASERFVFINNRKYREGEALQEGPAVERITRDGVVLRFQGLRFTVPRQ